MNTTTTKGEAKVLVTCCFEVLYILVACSESNSVSVSTKRGRGKSIHRRKTKRNTRLLNQPLLKTNHTRNKCQMTKKKKSSKKKVGKDPEELKRDERKQELIKKAQFFTDDTIKQVQATAELESKLQQVQDFWDVAKQDFIVSFL